MLPARHLTPRPRPSHHHRRPARRPHPRQRQLAQRRPLAFIADRVIFGDLVDDERFVTPYRRALSSLRERGARATLAALADEMAQLPPDL
jgi:hypothetical protein